MHHCKILNVVHVLRTRVELVYLQVLVLCVVWYRGGTPQDNGHWSEPLLFEESILT
jgi:hypothetical protein